MKTVLRKRYWRLWEHERKTALSQEEQFETLAMQTSIECCHHEMALWEILTACCKAKKELTKPQKNNKPI